VDLFLESPGGSQATHHFEAPMNDGSEGRQRFALFLGENDGPTCLEPEI